MARRVPKPLVPLLVVVSAIGFATAAALPSSAGPIITPGQDGSATTAPAPAPAPTTPAATTPPAPAPTTPPTAPTPPGPKDGPSPGPKDCAGCAQPSQGPSQD
ncbi:hypothetical protein AB0M54_03125 [Actinoplanes sp. NPDC051470]|uniref:hypothetical protein n=1 Tax=unclassified Actinoplanes TaxID=2626549 RepID=UPI00341ED84E